MTPESLLIIIGIAAAGAIAGACILLLYQKMKLKTFEAIAANLIRKAENDAEVCKQKSELDLKKKQVDQQRELELHWQQERLKMHREEERLSQREDKLESRMLLVEKKLSDIEKREAIILARKSQVEEEKNQVDELKIKLVYQLEQLSGLSATEARQHLLDKISHEVKVESANTIRRSIKEAEEEADRQAARIITTAINRLASPCVSETTVTTVSIPNDELKGRIIGKEGRNIRALERATGITFIIDDTPNTVVLSGFDPVRMQIAKVALTDLMNDGRIHPTRIEEAVEKAGETVKKQIRKYGEDAALRCGIINLHPELTTLVGKLKFRHSYGQNILDHSVEVSNLMGMMAAELGLDSQLAKRIGLLHDMGKAVTHEVQGTHALIGHDLAIKYGETAEVANGIGCHHHEIEPTTIEGSLCSAADAISASRPGARIEAIEEYIKRLKKLEEIAYEFPGVEKAFALQAGREIRIFVLPDMIDDNGTIHLARDLAKRIESDLSYPGKIKVTVTREKRAVEYAV